MSPTSKSSTRPKIILASSSSTSITSVAPNSICIGSGRFLRTVLVPALTSTKLSSSSFIRTIIMQTRSSTFLDYCYDKVLLEEKKATTDVVVTTKSQALTYEVDVVQPNGETIIQLEHCHGVGSLGTSEGRHTFYHYILGVIGCGLDMTTTTSSSSSSSTITTLTVEKSKAALLSTNYQKTTLMNEISIIGVGVTEGGLSSSTNQCLLDLSDVLRACMLRIQEGTMTIINHKICVVCTDNVPMSGDLLLKHMLDIIKSGYSNNNNDNNGNNDNDSVVHDAVEDTLFETFLKQKVSFLNTMVDRITSKRSSTSLSDHAMKGVVPRTEPCPVKALVIEDLNGDLPVSFANGRNNNDSNDDNNANIRLDLGVSFSMCCCLYIYEFVIPFLFKLRC